MLTVLGRVLRRLALVLGTLVLLQLAVVAVLWVVRRTYVPHGTVLELDLDGKLAEWVPDDPLAALVAGRRERLRDVLDALERGRDDDRVAGLVVRIGDVEMGLGQLQEVRDAVHAFALSHKPTVAFAETFGEFGPGNGAYYLATGFPEIWVQPSGDLGLTGILLETPFLRGTLDKLGLVAGVGHRKVLNNAL
jgi:protease-4